MTYKIWYFERDVSTGDLVSIAAVIDFQGRKKLILRDTRDLLTGPQFGLVRHAYKHLFWNPRVNLSNESDLFVASELLECPPVEDPAEWIRGVLHSDRA